MEIGDSQLVGELLLLDTFEQLRDAHTHLDYSLSFTGLIVGLLDDDVELMFPSIYDDVIAKRVRKLSRLVEQYRESRRFVMAEGTGFVAICEELKVDPAYPRRVVKEEFGLAYSPLILANACKLYMQQRERYAGKGSRGDE